MKPLFSFCLLPLAFGLGLNLSSCNSENKGNGGKDILTIFHAGSLSVPIKKIAGEFEKLYPEIDVQLEAAGSVTCVRKITDLKRHCDLIALADYSLIDRLLIPEHADWAFQFAANELCIAYPEDSPLAGELNEQNWHEVISREDIRYGRSDPDSDPCGYRTVLTLKLADRYYPQGVDWERILTKDQRFIRPKETDLLALVETNSVDCIFLYKSVAVQHKLSYLRLPDSINLGNPELYEFYAGDSLAIAGKEPGSSLYIKGSPMIYGFTIPLNAQNPEAARNFAMLMTDKDHGLKILEESGQKALTPELSPGSINKPVLQ